mgnify:CR=1 FL=1
MNTKFAEEIIWLYGEAVTVNCGAIHDYLGMDFDFSPENQVKISMIKHICKIFDTFPEEIGKPCECPAGDNLFRTRDLPGHKLPEEQARAFHHTVAQLLFLAMRARPDIQTAISFLTKRAREPDEDDWGKLKRVLQYLKGTKHIKLTLTVDNVSNICWWVHASYGAHMDLKGCTGIMMSLCAGAAMSFSRGQKLNVKSSTKCELVVLTM